MGNLYLLNIAFPNVLENNCKYSTNSLFIQISSWDKWTIISLSDDGIGMSDTGKEHFFTLFYQKSRGTWYWRVVSQKIILLHQGNIAVHSKEGEGSTFVIQLPHI